MKRKAFFIGGGALIVLIAVVFLVFLPHHQAGQRALKIIDMSGACSVERGGKTLEAVTDMPLKSGDIITVGDDGHARLQLDDDKYIYLNSGTRISLTAEGNADDSKTSVYVERGSMLTEVKKKLSAASSYTIVTPNTSMAIRGTKTLTQVLEDVVTGHVNTSNAVLEGQVKIKAVKVKADGTVVSVEKDLGAGEGNAFSSSKEELVSQEEMKSIADSGASVNGIKVEVVSEEDADVVFDVATFEASFLENVKSILVADAEAASGEDGLSQEEIDRLNSQLDEVMVAFEDISTASQEEVNRIAAGPEPESGPTPVFAPVYSEPAVEPVTIFEPVYEGDTADEGTTVITGDADLNLIGLEADDGAGDDGDDAGDEDDEGADAGDADDGGDADDADDEGDEGADEGADAGEADDGGAHADEGDEKTEAGEHQQQESASSSSHTHFYGTPVYSWSSDHSTCIATRECSCGEKQTAEATISTDTDDPNCTEAGSITYTAVFSADWAETKTESTTTSAIGHTLTAIAEKPATCTAAGISAYWQCSVCDELFSDSAGTQSITTAAAINALGHTLTAIAEKPATCTMAGISAYWQCSVCGDLFADADGTETITTAAAINALGHTLTAVAEKPATCTAPGVSAYWQCSVCGDLFADSDGTQPITTAAAINALGHTLTAVAEKPATCTVPGVSAYWQCSVCGDLFSDSDGTQPITTAAAINALGHTLTAVAEKPATCTMAGVSAYWQCSVCGELFADSDGTQPITTAAAISALGHTLTAIAEKPATCTAPGVSAYWQCSVCGELFADSDGTESITTASAISALGHTLTAIDEEPATCTEPGHEAYWQCSVCEALFSDAAGENQIEAPIVISTTAHDLEHREAVEQTCTEQGNIECWVCQNCETPFSDANGTSAIEWEDVFLDAPGHDLTPVAEKPATCTMAGISAYWQCSVCGDLFSDSEGTESITTAAAISALGHDYAAVVTDPTCTEQGYTTHTCTRCGDSYVDTYTNALDHDWGDPNWSWQIEGGDVVSVTATFTCGRDAGHTQTIEEIEFEWREGQHIDLNVDEGIAGKDVYMATVTLNGTDYSDSVEVPILLTPELPGLLFLSDGIGLYAEEAETVRELLNAYLYDHPATYNNDGLDGTYSFEGDLLEVVSTSSVIPDGTFEVTVTFDPVNNAFDSVSATTQIYIIKPLSDG